MAALEPSLHEALASYVPVLVTRRLADDPRPLTEARSERHAATVLYADISGFTALTEMLARQGPAGVEKVAAGLNGYFERLTAIIAAHGGDVVKFAGDALTAIWVAPLGLRDRRAAALPAIACGMAIQSGLFGYRISDGVDLSLRVGIGVSHVAAVHVGGLDGRWELVLTGLAVADGLRAEALAEPGEVVIAPRLWPLIEGQARGRAVADGFVCVEALAAEISLSPLLRPEIGVEAEAALCGYVPAAVASRLAAGQSSWLAELRRVAVLFISLPELSYTTPLADAQAVMLAVQAIVQGLEGSINHVSVDNHGATMMAAFGLPPLSHEDDAMRAVDAAQQLQEALGKLGWVAGMGVATGKAFCGSVGGASRCEYTVLGDVVNLAARLMQAADQRRPILCDVATFTAARAQFLFEVFPPIVVKGKAQPIVIHGPVSARLPVRAGARAVAGGSAGSGRPALVGRMRERVVLIGKLHDLLRGRSATVVVEGEVGLGKSRLADDLLDQAEAMGVPRLVGARDASDAAAAYHAWTPVFRPIFGLDDPGAEADPWGRVQRVLKQLAPRWLARAPLLAAALALDAADTDRTAGITGKARAEMTRELLVAVLDASLRGGPALLLIEDAHRVDSASWALLARVREQIEPLLCVLATGPIESETEPAPAELRQLLADASTHHLLLGPLSQVETEALVCRRLGVARVPGEVVDFLYGKAEGHPLFTEELASALRDAGLIAIVNGECHLSPETGDLQSAQFPDSLEAVITGRIDRLAPQLQLVLKVASVLGRVFPLSLLRAVHPIEHDRANLPEHLASLDRRGLLALRGGSVADPSYGFKHALTQDVAYNLLPFSQRQQLHQAVAEHYERVFSDRVELYYPLLAHHWYRVVAPGALVSEEQRPGPALVGRALAYLQRAGDQVLRNGVGQEAVEHYTHALELLPCLPPSSARTEQEIAVQIGRGNALIAARGLASEEVERTFARARELCREVGETRHLFPVLFGLWMYYFVRAEHDVSHELAEQLLVFAERRRERVPLMIAHRTLGTQLFHRGELVRAAAHLERAIALYAPDFDRPLAFLYTQDPRVAGLSVLALCVHLLGSAAEADERCNVALGVARELGNAASSALAIGHAAILRQIGGDDERARAHVEAQAQLDNEHGSATWQSFAAVVQAWSLARRGQVEEGLDLLRQAMLDLQAAGMAVFWPWVLGVHADLCRRAGQRAEAEAHLRAAIATSRRSGERVWEPGLLRKLGELLAARASQPDAADAASAADAANADDAVDSTVAGDTDAEGTPERCLVAAILLAREQGSRVFERRAALALAALGVTSPEAAAVLAESRERLADEAGEAGEASLEGRALEDPAPDDH